VSNESFPSQNTSKLMSAGTFGYLGGTYSAPPSPLADLKGPLRRRTRMEVRSIGWKERTGEGEEGQRARKKMREQEREKGE